MATRVIEIVESVILNPNTVDGALAQAALMEQVGIPEAAQEWLDRALELEADAQASAVNAALDAQAQALGYADAAERWACESPENNPGPGGDGWELGDVVSEGGRHLVLSPNGWVPLPDAEYQRYRDQLRDDDGAPSPEEAWEDVRNGYVPGPEYVAHCDLASAPLARY